MLQIAMFRTAQEPKEFATLEAIAENFGAKDPKARGTSADGPEKGPGGGGLSCGELKGGGE